MIEDKGKPLDAEVLLLRTGIVVEKTRTDESGYYEFSATTGRHEILPVAAGYQSRGWYSKSTADKKVDFSLTPIPETPPQRA